MSQYLLARRFGTPPGRADDFKRRQNRCGHPGARDSGQAMAEYAIVVGALMGAVIGVGWTFVPRFLHALQLYYDNFFFWLNMPIP